MLDDPVTADAWLRIAPKVRRRWDGSVIVDSCRVSGVTKGRPALLHSGEVAVHLILHINRSAFLPVIGEVEVEVEDDRVAVEVRAAAGELEEGDTSAEEEAAT